MNTLYGDGVHDDAPAIQALLDSGASEIALPAPKKHYAIGSTLRIHGGQTLRLGSTAEIRLLPGSNCCMLANAAPGTGEEHIAVVGGIWNRDNQNQAPNPWAREPAPGEEYPSSTTGPDYYWASPLACIDAAAKDGAEIPREKQSISSAQANTFIMCFTHVKYFTLRDLAFKDPTNFAFFGAYLTHFTVENIRFDFNHGNPYATNMDGIHLEGGCRFGHIRNLQGACYDDLLALNADDFIHGPIEDIEVDGIFSGNCHSAVRMLSTKSWIRRVTISNVHGTFYQYCVGITRFHYREEERDCLGLYDDIALRNIFAAKAPRHSFYGKDNGYVFSLVWIEQSLHINRLHIEHISRLEEVEPIPTILVQPHTQIGTLSIAHASQKKKIAAPITFLRNEGSIQRLFLRDIDLGGDTLLRGDGYVACLYADEQALEVLSGS